MAEAIIENAHMPSKFNIQRPCTRINSTNPAANLGSVKFLRIIMIGMRSDHSGSIGDILFNGAHFAHKCANPRRKLKAR